MTKRSQQSVSYSKRILRSAFSGWGARIGLTWVIILAFVACFSPLLANSMPLLVSENGQLSLPILRYLNAEDLMLMVLFVVMLLLWKMPLKFSTKAAVASSSALIALLVGLAILSPPKTVIYDQFREKAAAGSYDWQVLPPIPYSPSDYLRDIGGNNREAVSYNGDGFNGFRCGEPDDPCVTGRAQYWFYCNRDFHDYRHYNWWSNGLFCWSFRYDWHAHC